MKKILFVVLVLSFFILGCSNKNVSEETFLQSEEYVDQINDFVEVANEDEVEIIIADNKMTYCLVDFAGANYVYIFAKDMTFMEVGVMGEGVKSRVDKNLFCSWSEDVDEQCTPVSESGGFDEVTNAWRDTVNVLNGDCEEIPFDESMFR